MSRLSLYKSGGFFLVVMLDKQIKPDHYIMAENMKKLELKIPPVAVVVIVGAAMWLVSIVLPKMHLMTPSM